MGAWSVPGAPAGSFNGNDWVRTQRAYEEGAAVKTADSLYFGFGFEGVTGAAQAKRPDAQVDAVPAAVAA